MVLPIQTKIRKQQILKKIHQLLLYKLVKELKIPIEHVRNIAKEIVAADADLTNPRNSLLLRELRRLKKSPFDWSSIS